MDTTALSSSDASSLLAAILAVGLVMVLFFVIWYVLLAIALWKTFEKAGEAGWKAIIPFYNVYVMYKISWKTSMFWVWLVLTIVSSFISGVPTDDLGSLGSLISFVICIALIVVEVMQLYKLSVCFGHGAGWTVGLLFLNPFFMLGIGFGKSQYKAPLAAAKAEPASVVAPAPEPPVAPAPEPEQKTEA